jgi:hypothetical protein
MAITHLETNVSFVLSIVGENTTVNEIATEISAQIYRQVTLSSFCRINVKNKARSCGLYGVKAQN